MDNITVKMVTVFLVVTVLFFWRVNIVINCFEFTQPLPHSGGS